MPNVTSVSGLYVLDCPLFLCLVCPMLPASLDCMFLIAPSVPCLVCPMLPVSLDCMFLIAPSVLCLVCPMLPVSLDCMFLIAPLVFSNVYLKLKCLNLLVYRNHFYNIWMKYLRYQLFWKFIKIDESSGRNVKDLLIVFDM
jgi:hypothetical protein